MSRSTSNLVAAGLSDQRHDVRTAPGLQTSDPYRQRSSSLTMRRADGAAYKVFVPFNPDM